MAPNARRESSGQDRTPGRADAGARTPARTAHRAPGARAIKARETDDRILSAALQSFGTKGYDATSLDALAGELGITKQTILYHHPSKAALLDAVIDRASGDLTETFDQALSAAGPGWDRIDALVRSVFRMALRRPELLGLIREVSRLGAPASTRVARNLEPLVARAQRFLAAEMDAGRMRRSDPSLVLVSAYSTVVGVATEVEVLRAVGIEPTLRSTVIRRRELLAFLHSALVAPAATP